MIIPQSAVKIKPITINHANYYGMPSVPYLFQQATMCPPPLSVSGGIFALHSSVAYLQRVLKGQPDGMFSGLGTSPSRMIRFRSFACFGSGYGTAESRDWVYG